MAITETSVGYQYYWNMFKGNYSKGVRGLQTILANKTLAEDLCSSPEAMAVLLGTPVGTEDPNSETLRNMIIESDYLDQAIESWLKGYYDFDNLVEVFADDEAREFLMNDEFYWRILSPSENVSFLAFLAQLDLENPENYNSYYDVINSSVAMGQIANSKERMELITDSSMAMEFLVNSDVAMELIANSNIAMESIINSDIAIEAATNSVIAMELIANSNIAMELIINSDIAIEAVTNSVIAMEVISNSSIAMELIINSDIAIEAVTNSVIAMEVIANSRIVMEDVANSSVAMETVANSSVAMEVVANSSIAMEVIATSSISMEKVVNSSIAIGKIASSSVAMGALYTEASFTQPYLTGSSIAMAAFASLSITSASISSVGFATIYSNPCFVLSTKNNEAWRNEYGYTSSFVVGSSVITSAHSNASAQTGTRGFVSSLMQRRNAGTGTVTYFRW